MANSHLEAIRSGVKYNNDLKTLTNSLVGSKKHPRGKVLMAFNRAKKALEGSFDNPAAMDAILKQYKQEVLTLVGEGSLAAYDIGSTHVNNLLTSYDLPLTGEEQATMVKEGMASAEALLANQISAIQSGTLTEAQVLGGPARVGMFAAGIITSQAANWFTMMAATRVQVAIFHSLERSGKGGEFVKQVVAAIDENTTPCCLDAHGQWAEIKDDFFTPEAPAFADFQQRPPFHRFCRTSQVLVLRAMRNDSLTQDMKMAALLEGTLREQPDYWPVHPANAFSRIRTGRGVPITPTVTIPKSVKDAVAPTEWATLGEAEKFAEATYGVRADYSQLSLKQANAVNRGLQKTSRVFDLDNLDEIFMSTHTGGIAAFNMDTHKLIIDNQQFNNATIKIGSKADRLAKAPILQQRLFQLEETLQQVRDNPGMYQAGYRGKIETQVAKLKVKLTDKHLSGRWLAGNNMEDIVVHEMGHHVHSMLEKGAYPNVHGFRSPGELRQLGIDWKGSIGERVMNDFWRTEGHRLSDYGSTDGFEYFAESFIAFVNGETDSIHDDLLAVFNEIKIGEPGE